MAVTIRTSGANPSEKSSPVLIALVHSEDLARDGFWAEVDAQLGGALGRLAEEAKFVGNADQLLDVPTLGLLGPERLLLVGAGSEGALTAAALRRSVAVAFRAAIARPIRAAALRLPPGIRGASLRAAAEGIVLGEYRFTKYLTGERQPGATLSQVTLHMAGRVTAADRKALELGAEVGRAVCLARDAVNEPPNELSPAVLAERARAVAREGRLKVKVLDKKGIAAAGMKLHYAVGQGSANEPRFIHLTYKPSGAKRGQKRLVYVGKGLTFDSGGICIKPAGGMWEMKSDMGGAAAVLGLMAAVAKTRPNVEVHGIIGAAENMPDAAAYRPGDVFGSLDGKTVEVINTDAEGRLVLADALAYARKLNPDLIVDAATLTGACVVALGKGCSAFYCDDDALARRMSDSANAAGENFWRMPLMVELAEQLKSEVADLKHVGDRWGGSITAALFLKEFVGGLPWLHCDIAGPALADQARGIYPKGGTGHPVLTFLDLVESFA